MLTGAGHDALAAGFPVGGRLIVCQAGQLAGEAVAAGETVPASIVRRISSAAAAACAAVQQR